MRPTLTIQVDEIGGPSEWGDADHIGALLDENGVELWHHHSSSRLWLEGDLLRNFPQRVSALDRAYPDGFDVVWKFPAPSTARRGIVTDPERLAEPLTDRLEQLRHNCTYHAEVNCMVAAADVLALFAERDALATENQAMRELVEEGTHVARLLRDHLTGDGGFGGTPTTLDCEACADAVDEFLHAASLPPVAPEGEK